MTMSSDQDKISSYFCHVLILLLSPPFYDTYVQLPNENYPAPNKISSNSKLSPYFDNALGATDGTQISCLPSSEEWESSCNHMGGITQNILACCSFDLRLQYFLSGADSGSSNATLFIDACTSDMSPPWQVLPC
jgi:hypothetical protein